MSVLALAQLHKLLVYTSPNLKDWTYVSEFGPVHAVGGVWECPSFIPLPLDGDTSNVKWVAQIGLNPGGPPGTIGSGTQYVIGTFNGTAFVEDEKVITPIEVTEFQGFEGTGTFADLGWTATGDFIDAVPASGALPGQQTVTGYKGSRLVNTFLDGDATTGTITSPSFNISHKYINFLVGGGHFPDQECINLVIGGEVVLTATGSNSEALVSHTWDVTSFVGQVAVIEIVDQLTGGWGHINVDEITFSDAKPEDDTNWMDWGPDFYAVTTFNGMSWTDRVDIAWMSNWQYGAVIPTDPWRSAMTIPRKLSLQTINEKTMLVQQPTGNLASLEKGRKYSKYWHAVPAGNTSLSVSGKTLDITLSFSDRKGPGQFGLILRANDNLTQGTHVGYDFSTKQMFLDRSKSGDVGFDDTFASVYYAPLEPGSDGVVKMRILLDWSSVEVFGGQGEVTLTAQIFPNDKGSDVWAFSSGGKTRRAKITAKGVKSAW